MNPNHDNTTSKSNEFKVNLSNELALWYSTLVCTFKMDLKIILNYKFLIY